MMLQITTVKMYNMLTICYNITGDVMAGKSCNDLEEPETSSVTVKNGCNEVGGYDCDFVESPADDLLCKICHFPARNPRLTNECCGQTFCAACLKKYMDSKILDNKLCPYCKTEPFNFVCDVRTKRYVESLKVFCPRKVLGCTWTGELRSLEQHLVKDIDNRKGCPFTELQCSNGCGVVMQRRLIEGHLKSECELREVKCEYCNTTGSYQWINSSHCEECPKYPVECPNHCEVGRVRREEISRHLEECLLTIVECPYAAVGCGSVVRRKDKMEHVIGSVGQHMECNKTSILDNQNNLKLIKEDLLANQNEFQKKLDAKNQEIKFVKQKLRAKEQELDDIRRDLCTKNQAIVTINKDLQDTKEKLEQSDKIQSQLKTAIVEKGRELDEVKRNAEEIYKTLQKMIRQLKNKLEGTEQSLQHQQKVNTQLKSQVETIFNFTWPLQLYHFASSGNEVIPIVIKLAEFEKYKNNQSIDLTGFYTTDGGYKMCLRVYPNGCPVYNNRVSVWVPLMKGDHDDHLAWPVKGTLTVQLLNQLSDSNHSVPVEFHFNGFTKACQRVTIGTRSSYGKWCHQFMPYERLSYDADKKCQYLKDDCLFFRVCNFQ